MSARDVVELGVELSTPFWEFQNSLTAKPKAKPLLELFLLPFGSFWCILP